MLTFNLKKQWYKKIRSGEKTIEYRKVKPYWTKRLGNINDGSAAFVWVQFASADRPKCILRLGYTKRHMTAEVTEIEIVDGKDTDLHIDKPVYAIHLANVRERI